MFEMLLGRRELYKSSSGDFLELIIKDEFISVIDGVLTGNKRSAEYGSIYSFADNGLKVKKISARFNYPDINNSLSVCRFMHNKEILLGISDDWIDNNNGFRIYADGYTSQTIYRSPFNGILTYTFNNPIYLNELTLQIGGLSGYNQKPIYLSEVEFTYV